jgi:hypothetical protein
LPIYQTTKAIDVFSSGTYSDLPLSIKKRHIPDRPLTPEQQILTLRWLKNTIQYRLLQETVYLPSGFTSVEVKNGMAIFTAANEFSVKMTLFPVEEDPIEEDLTFERWRWTVLDVDILVVDYEVGCGEKLVHPLHKGPLIALCQSRITQNQEVRAD